MMINLKVFGSICVLVLLATASAQNATAATAETTTTIPAKTLPTPPATAQPTSESTASTALRIIRGVASFILLVVIIVFIVLVCYLLKPKRKRRYAVKTSHEVSYHRPQSQWLTYT